MIHRDAGRLIGRAAYALVFVTLFAIVGKCCQYAGVALLADMLGFEVSSAAGLAPFIALLVFAKVRHPRWFAWHSA